MAKLDEKNLEKALNKNEETPNRMNKEQEIAFHQGALNSLVGERDALIQVIMLAEQRMQAHLKRLEELGVKIQRQEKK